MKDFFTKIKILFKFYTYIGMDIETWKEEVWDRGLDDEQCCSAGPNDYCGCGGITVRQAYDRPRHG